ncbi:hypothetical protein ACFE04_002755 [Oxalis oulophora]
MIPPSSSTQASLENPTISTHLFTPLPEAKNLDLTPFTELTPPPVITTSTLLTSTSGTKERNITLLSLALFTKVKGRFVTRVRGSGSTSQIMRGVLVTGKIGRAFAKVARWLVLDGVYQLIYEF